MFSVQLPQFQGTLDLLLTAVRKKELDILAVPIAEAAQQAIAYTGTVTQPDVNAAGDDLALLSTLLEMKAAQALNPEENKTGAEKDIAEEQPPTLPAAEFRLSEKAMLLQQRGEIWQRCFPRLTNDLTAPSRDNTPQLQNAELWDLVSAFGRMFRQNAPQIKHEIIYDDTPIQVHAGRIYQQLQHKRRLAFRSLFKAGQHKSSLVGLFLASLELVRHEFANVYQERNFGEIELTYRQSSKTPDFAGII